VIIGGVNEMLAGILPHLAKHTPKMATLVSSTCLTVESDIKPLYRTFRWVDGCAQDAMPWNEVRAHNRHLLCQHDEQGRLRRWNTVFTTVISPVVELLLRSVPDMGCWLSKRANVEPPRTK
jgi:hypothetical protein